MMKRALAALSVLFGASGGAASADLAVGARAPDFALQGSDGKTWTLAEFAGKEGVVLAWFPKAFTPG
ncbi:MAG: redoxin domain-containing protein [Deltaproteobacteria bacterium]|nr:redoxin domain-containing protein [Deltaproteobacteria bacterium]